MGLPLPMAGGMHRSAFPAAAAAVALIAAGFVTAALVPGLAKSSPPCWSNSAHNACNTSTNSPGQSTTTTQSQTTATTTPTTTTAPTTTTSTTTTTTTATTTTTTTSSANGSSWANLTDFVPASFTPTRTIDVYTASDFWSAWNNIAPGDEINVHGVTFSGEATFSGKQLSDWAEVNFDSATTFSGVSSGNYPAVWVHGDSHIRFYGGTITNRYGGVGTEIADSSYFTWWNFVIHDTGASGLFVPGLTSADDHLDIKGEIYHWGLNLALDPHAEKGTGLQGAMLADAYYGVKNSRFAIYAHDSAAGSGLSIGGSSSTDGFWGNTVYAWCQNLSMRATSQVAGNCVQVWGNNVSGNDYKYIEGENLQGRPYDANGMNSGQSLSTDTVEYGTASNTNLNPYLAQTEPSIPADMHWDSRYSTQFGSASPKP